MKLHAVTQKIAFRAVIEMLFHLLGTASVIVFVISIVSFCVCGMYGAFVWILLSGAATFMYLLLDAAMVR